MNARSKAITAMAAVALASGGALATAGVAHAATQAPSTVPAAQAPAIAAPGSVTVPNDPDPACTATPGTQICVGFVYNGPTLTGVQMDQEVSSAVSGVTYRLTGPNGWNAEAGPYSSDGAGWLPQFTSSNGNGGPGNYCADSYAGGVHLGHVCKAATHVLPRGLVPVNCAVPAAPWFEAAGTRQQRAWPPTPAACRARRCWSPD